MTTLKNLAIALATLLLISLIGCTKSKGITGTWRWKSGNSNTDIYLVQNGNQVTGKHCSSFMSGSKLDCVDPNEDDSITLNLVSENVFEGTIKSEFSEAIISVRLTLNPYDEKLYFTQLVQPNEEYYLPNNVTMTLAQD